MKLSFVVLSNGRSFGQVIPIAPPSFVIGRGPACHLRPSSQLVSKRHCEVVMRPSGVVVCDFESANGTFVNEVRIEGEASLEHDDVLRVGPLAFRILVEHSTEANVPRTNEEVAADVFTANDGVSAETVSVSTNSDETTEVELQIVGPDSLKSTERKKIGDNAREAAQEILSKFKFARRSRSSVR